MGLIVSVRGYTPKIDDSCFVAENATVIGDVTVGEGSSIWFGAVVRGDVNKITIGKNVNIQDNAVIHTLYEKSVAVIGDNVSIAHNAVVHGATLKNNCLVGIGAVVLDNAVIGEGALVAANSVVLSGTIIEPNSLYGGVPAKKIKNVSPETAKNTVQRISDNYSMYASWYKK
ncbi:MAG: gamma carbonic anhydrase family protein [Bacteroidetes bacterium]|nr:gamma carbonic anhydrase family protein [Bacteroidota bacterium]